VTNEWTSGGGHSHRILKRIQINAKPEKVWPFLVKPEFMEKWLPKPIGFEPIVGHRFVFASECDGVLSEIQSEVLAFAEFEEIKFSWIDPSIDLESVIGIELEQVGDTTHLTLSQHGWRSASPTRQRHALTWQQCLEDLRSLVNSSADNKV